MGKLRLPKRVRVVGIDSANKVRVGRSFQTKTKKDQQQCCPGGRYVEVFLLKRSYVSICARKSHSAKSKTR